MAVAVPSSVPAVTSPLLIRHVTLRAGSTTILSSISLKLLPGEMCALIGPSGSGKSSLIKVLLGVRKPNAGQVRMGALEVGQAGPVGYVPQDDALHGALPVRAALTYAARLRLPQATDAARAQRVDQLLQQLGLADRAHLRISRLSGGQRKRVSVALELLTSPGLLILDEPTSGLDPGMEAHLMGVFAQVAKSGRVLLVSTHAMESLHRCQALVVLVAGNLAYFGPPADALPYFGVAHAAAIFPALAKAPARQWAQRCESDAGCQRFAARTAVGGAL